MQGIALWYNYNKSGKSFLKLGNYADAERMFTEALKVAEELGPKDPHLCVSLVNLARALQAMGKADEAEVHLNRALLIAETERGTEHIDVAAIANALAGLYQAEGKLEDAEPFFRRALQIMEKALGPEHTGLATVLENYASCLRQMGRKDEAGNLEGRAMAIRNQAAKDAKPKP